MKSTSSRGIAALATMLLVLNVLVLGIVVWLGLNSPVDPYGGSDVAFGLTLLPFPLVGWLIAVRQRRNPLGWIFLIFTTIVGIGAIIEELVIRGAYYDLQSASAVPLIVGSWLVGLGYWLLFGPSILLFPDGRFPGKGLRWAFWGCATLLVLFGVISLIGTEMVCVDRFGEASDPCIQSVPNPLGLGQILGVGEGEDVLLTGVILLTVMLSFSAVIYRYRRSIGDVRLQIKWVAWAASAGLIVFMGLFVAEDLLSLPMNEWVNVIAFMVISIGLPVAIGVAILRYRLYDIDRIISRTASYTLVISLLAAVYVVSVTLIQQILPVQNQFGIVVSTLVVAATFNPLRRRVQAGVDRRFNRSRYDAQRVLSEFSSELRDDVDLEQVQAALLKATRESMQPSHMSVWVRKLETGER